MKVSFVKGSSVLISDECRAVMGSTRKGRVYELGLVESFFNRMMEVSDTPVFLDIGANTGSFSLLPTFNKKVSCYSFEPNPKTYSILKENIVLNDIEDYTKAYNFGMWSSNKTLKLKVPINRGDSGIATFGNNPTRIPGEYEVKDVSCITIDHFVGSSDLKLDAIKIDTEGSELAILKGGVNTLMSQLPLLLFEYDNKNTEQFGYDRDDIVALLESYGYNKFEVYKRSDMFAY